MKLGILESPNADHRHYLTACREMGVEHTLIPFFSDHWRQAVLDAGCDGFLARPPCDYPERKAVHDERLWLLNQVMRRPVYPSLHELLLYENKRLQADLKDLYGIPSPRTWVFTSKAEALRFVDGAQFPLVTKRNIGSKGSGVAVLRTKAQARRFLGQVFGHGLENFSFGKVWTKSYGGIPVPVLGTVQRNYALFQEYHAIKWEWRVIRIGLGYFGRQKLLGKDGMASGSGLSGWVPPPPPLLHFAREVCDKLKFSSMALDMFETLDGTILVNEMQSVFGARDDVQLRVNGKPGRFVFREGSFVFEAGEFNRLSNYPLRVEHFLEQLRTGTAVFDAPVWRPGDSIAPPPRLVSTLARE